MSATEQASAVARPGATRGLRASSLAAVVMLVAQYSLGMWVNLYARLPASDHGAGIPAGLANAVTDGPVGLGVHAILGLALVVTALSVTVRAVLVRRRVPIVAAVIGVAAIVVAALVGAHFVGHPANGASMAMALASGAAILAYAAVLFAAPATTRPPNSPSQPRRRSALAPPIPAGSGTRASSGPGHHG
ncbi:MAG: hypothetical protein ACRDYD_13240 [Acidimicrobiales bacterium]